MVDLNFNNTVTTDSGNLIFSGISSGVDSQSVINAIINAKRMQAVEIENKISANNDRITAFGELKTLSTTFRDVLDTLRGSSSFFATDVFDSKLAFTDSRATASAPADHTPSLPDSLLGVTVGNDAINGTHTVEVVALAEAHQLRSDTVSDKTTDLSTIGFTMGDFTLNGRAVTVAAGDTLLDLRDKINSTNTGATPSNVNASIVSVSSTEHYIVLTSSETGTANDITFGGTQAVHNSFGFTNAGLDTIKNEINVSADATIRVNNLGIDITRSSNTITDVIEGVTIDLYKAEANTEMVIDIETDLNTIKTSVVDFVNAYNELKAFAIDQRTEKIREEGGDAEFGILGFDTTLRQIEAKLGELMSTSVNGLQSGYSSLSQVGISINDNFMLEIDDADFDEKILADSNAIRKLFAFDFSSSDSRVTAMAHTANTSYTVDGSNVVEPYYLNISGTDASGDILSSNIQTTTVIGNGGIGDASTTSEGNIVTVTENSGAEGLKILFNGAANLGNIDDISISFTRGIADQLFTFFDDVVKNSGQIDSITQNFTEQNIDYEERVSTIDSRLEIQRKTLNAKFLAMEEALMRLNSLRDQLTKMMDAANSDN